MRSMILSAAGSRSFSLFIALLERLGDRNPHLLRVLTYHRVDYPDAKPDLYPGTISATPDEFSRQMEFLLANYRVVEMNEILEAVRHHRELPPRAVLITFDDAYCDFSNYAWPILKQCKLPATLFVPTAFPDQPQQVFWWDRLYRAICRTAYDSPLMTPLGDLPLFTNLQRKSVFRRLLQHVKSLPDKEVRPFVDGICEQVDNVPPVNSVLDWRTLSQMASEGLTLGAHTRTHPLMNRIPVEEARQQAVASREDLKNQFGSALPILAYPGGALSDEVAQMLKREQFELAFTTQRGINDLRNVDRMRIRRMNVGRCTTLAVMRASLLPSARYFNRCWSPG